MQTVPCQARSLPLTLSVFNNFFDFSAISCCVFIPPGHVPLTSVFLTWSHYHSLALSLSRVGYPSLLLFISLFLSLKHISRLCKIQIFFWCICFIITVNKCFCCFLTSRLTQQSDQHLPTEVTMCTCKHKVSRSLIATFYVFEMWL